MNIKLGIKICISCVVFLLINIISFNCLDVKATTKAEVLNKIVNAEKVSTKSEIGKVLNDSEKIENVEIERVVQKQIEMLLKYDINNTYVTFVFDDALQDIDLVASIFDEYNYPLCLAVIPEKLSDKCSGLTYDKGKYRRGMTVKEVAEQVVSQGGEVLSHGYTPLTSENISDEDTIKEIFYSNKQQLVDYGFVVNGIILNGGSNALRGGTKEQGGYIMQYYASKNFLYSDQYGVTEQYYHPRINLNKATNKCIDDINNAIIEKKWIIFMGHSITGIYNEKYLTEQHLRTILQFCKDNKVDVVTYANIYDMYGKYVGK